MRIFLTAKYDIDDLICACTFLLLDRLFLCLSNGTILQRAFINMKEYQIFVKLHPYLYKQLREEQQIMGCYIPGAVDESELLPFVDLLITDYSGICTPRSFSLW